MKLLKKIYPVLITTSLIGGVSLYQNFTPTNYLTPQKAHAQSQQTNKTSLLVIAYLDVKPEHRQTFLDLATEVKTLTNQTEKGANSYTFYEDKKNPNSFFFFEDWQNQQALDEHLEKPYTRRLTQKFEEILVKPADVRIYRIKEVETIQVP